MNIIEIIFSLIILSIAVPFVYFIINIGLNERKTRKLMKKLDDFFIHRKDL